MQIFIRYAIPYQQAHSADCRKRILKLMREDPEDRLRVEHWEHHHKLTEKDETEDIAKEMDTDADKDVSRRGEKRQPEVRRPEKARKRDREESDEDTMKRIEKELGISRY